MKQAISYAVKISALTTVGLGGWYAGKNFERIQHLKEDDRECIASSLTLQRLPCLPIFGTVSAASPFVPADQTPEMGTKLSSTASRVSEVSSTKF